MITTTEAAEAAREALLEQVGSDVVGAGLGAVDEGDHVSTHRFACTQAGYRGWNWCVTAVALPDQPVTIDEIVLLPGDDAIVAPPWVPWRDRIQPGDLSPGDILPVEEDDPRLVPGYLAGDPVLDDAEPLDRQLVRSVTDEIGLGRARVLSVEGRDAAVERWYAGDGGPDVPLAKSAPAKCETCGFLVRLSGPLSTMFGVCANGDANDDGRVVALDHGCGGHSEAQLRRKHLPQPLPDPVFDSLTWDELEQI